MSKHTPGPWFIFGNGHCVGGPAIAPLGESQTAGIAMCSMSKRHTDECVANAKLIAAAPELLRVLREALDFIQLNHDDTGIETEINSAIRMAEGK